MLSAVAVVLLAATGSTAPAQRDRLADPGGHRNAVRHRRRPAHRRGHATTIIFRPRSHASSASAACSIRTSSASSRSGPTWSFVYATQSRAQAAAGSRRHRLLSTTSTGRCRTSRRRSARVGARIGSAARADAVAAGDGSARSPRSARRRRRCRIRRRCWCSSAIRSSLRNVYASGGYGFLHDMLEIAGGATCSRDVKRQSVQASTEMMLARKPDVDHRALVRRQSPRTSTSPGSSQAWNALASVPAVRNHRVDALAGDEFVVPGPRVVGGDAPAGRERLHPGQALSTSCEREQPGCGPM